LPLQDLGSDSGIRRLCSGGRCGVAYRRFCVLFPSHEGTSHHGSTRRSCLPARCILLAHLSKLACMLAAAAMRLTDWRRTMLFSSPQGACLLACSLPTMGKLIGAWNLLLSFVDRRVHSSNFVLKFWIDNFFVKSIEKKLWKWNL
jgi:hypothetical protein